VIEPTLIRKLEYLLRPDDGPPMSDAAKRLLREAIEDTRSKGIEADIRAGWFTGEQIQKRWQVGSRKVTAIRKKLGMGKK
jgi:hypothetical protein